MELGALHSLIGHEDCRVRQAAIGLDPGLLTIDPRSRHIHLYPTIPSKGHL